MASALRFDGEPERQDEECAECGQSYRLIKAFIKRDGDAHAVAFIALHKPGAVREAWIDVILGTFGADMTDDHFTFGCRVGPIEGQVEPAASLVTGAIPYGDQAIWGQKLTRKQALEHPRLPDFWEVVDYVLVTDPEVRSHVYAQR